MPSLHRKRQIMGTGIGLALLWSYWPVLVDVAKRWSTDPTYSHGYLVPLFAGWLLWKRYKSTSVESGQEEWVGSWWGIPLLLVGVAMHAGGALLYFDALSEFSFLATLAGLCLCFGGWTFLSIAWPSIGFLIFMLPLPYRVEVALALPLQNLATSASAYLLQMFGLVATAEGNNIGLTDGVLSVVEACNGLGMLVTFFALATAVAIVIDRPWLDKVVIVASAVPVALISNILRITLTGVLFETVGSRVALVIYHDLAGWLMMPLALGLMWVELKMMSRLLVSPPPEVPLDIGLDSNEETFSRCNRRQEKKCPVSW